MSIKITKAKNGLILEIAGETYVLRSLSDLLSINFDSYMAHECGTTAKSVYGEHRNANSLLEVRGLVVSGNKMDAIRLLRDVYTVRLGLKEAKELVELIGGEL